MRTISIFCVLFLISFSPFAQKTIHKPESGRPLVGLVLSGGGAKGFAYIGLLKAIQKAGLPIDYIGGSSIGSIIGGLYAIGYHPDSIAKIIRAQDWDDLLRDVIKREYIAFEEKEHGEDAIVRLPIKDKTIRISAAMYKGQEVTMMLNYYFSPVYRENDFRKLPTPFLCIGTDLLTGEEVILDSGYLPMAIRASMSIPGFFDPTEYMGHYLVDGGVVNNYPVQRVKQMGAEIIIGGDVQSGLYTTREELSSVTAILDQITSFYRMNANLIGDSLTNLKVRFPPDYGMMEFGKYDSIIALGERIANEAYPHIKALADSLNRIAYRPLKPCLAKPLDTVYIDSIKITGSKRVPKKYFETLLFGKDNSLLSLKQLEEDLRQMTGSGFFERVTYKLEATSKGTNLLIDAPDAGVGDLGAAVHFDNDYSVSILLNAAFRNMIGRNTKLFADLSLGPNPRLRVVYLAGFGRMAAIGMGADLYQFKYNLYDKDVKISKVASTNYKVNLFFNYNLHNRYNLKTGFDYEYFRSREDYPTDTVSHRFQDFASYGTVFASLSADTRDRSYFSRKGFTSFLRIEYIMPFSNSRTQDYYTNSAEIFLKYDHYIPLSRKFTLIPGLFAGFLLNRSMIPPPQHIFALGGLSPNNYIDQYAAFTGVQFLQEYGYYSVVTRMKLQYNVYKKLYLTYRMDAGANVNHIEELYESRNFLIGYGLTAGYDSFIGPLELSLMASNINPKPMLYLNIGFSF